MLYKLLSARSLFGMIIFGYFVFIFSHLWRDTTASTIFDWIDVGIHETGHIVFLPLAVFFPRIGEPVMAAGGTFWQLFTPLVISIAFYRRGDNIGGFFGLGWLAVNLLGVSHYMERAVDMAGTYAAPLSFLLSAGTRHDWNYLFSYFGILDHYRGISSCVEMMGYGIFFLAFGLGIFFAVRYLRSH